ncbi:dentin sialophosphoprotein [Erpetoichthys calabaricus]|uniref:dentin sialophosphoprotein n=1 Tax=Erpetoichthys calabaricus TaxID=27687 RepID=UPI0010A07505|nr:dentin sialophosphoprotein [Erpetoichthys calabaricus]XP_028665551.1 dentin sialophosphoprotein [Erpetoichthys calabaricus]XP_028665553.1 dentin sialophosphoprotein [Erpetoichthys calabaricus]XP_028665554.1 dentin sialophosphoprotein [Erpetoichthys calabaricus]XP_051788014.1 dentin sialophosphoprotein [Erpetoichthys calabaricus]
MGGKLSKKKKGYNVSDQKSTDSTEPQNENVDKTTESSNESTEVKSLPASEHNESQGCNKDNETEPVSNNGDGSRNLETSQPVVFPECPNQQLSTPKEEEVLGNKEENGSIIPSDEQPKELKKTKEKTRLHEETNIEEKQEQQSSESDNLNISKQNTLEKIPAGKNVEEDSKTSEDALIEKTEINKIIISPCQKNNEVKSLTKLAIRSEKNEGCENVKHNLTNAETSNTSTVSEQQEFRQFGEMNGACGTDAKPVLNESQAQDDKSKTESSFQEAENTELKAVVEELPSAAKQTSNIGYECQKERAMDTEVQTNPCVEETAGKECLLKDIQKEANILTEVSESKPIVHISTSHEESATTIVCNEIRLCHSDKTENEESSNAKSENVAPETVNGSFEVPVASTLCENVQPIHYLEGENKDAQSENKSELSQDDKCNITEIHSTLEIRKTESKDKGFFRNANEMEEESLVISPEVPVMLEENASTMKPETIPEIHISESQVINESPTDNIEDQLTVPGKCENKMADVGSVDKKKSEESTLVQDNVINRDSDLPPQKNEVRYLVSDECSPKSAEHEKDTADEMVQPNEPSGLPDTLCPPPKLEYVVETGAKCIPEEPLDCASADKYAKEQHFINSCETKNISNLNENEVSNNCEEVS